MKTALRINFFVQSVHEQGTYFRFHNLAIALVELGHTVIVFGCDENTKSKPRHESRNGVNYWIMPSSKGTTFFLSASHPLNAARRWLGSYPSCDVAHLFQPFPSGFSAWAKCRAKRKFYDWDDLWIGGLLHGPPTSWKERWIRLTTGALERKLPACADHVTTCSRFLADLALQRGGQEASVIHNGIWPFPLRKKSDARKVLGLDAEALYVGFMGKTCDELSWCFDAVAANLESVPRLRLALCGMTSELLEKAASNVRLRIDYLGYLSPETTRDFAAALDMGLLPLADNPFNQSRFPIKYEEYMAAGTPVLCSDVGECAQFSDILKCVLSAGTNKEEWLASFKKAIEDALGGFLPRVDHLEVNETLSWKKHALILQHTYQRALDSSVSAEPVAGSART